MSRVRLTPLHLVVTAWIAATVAFWLWLNLTDAGTREFEHLFPPTHGYWFNVLDSVVAIPIALGAAQITAEAYGLRSQVGRAVMLLALGVTCWGVGSMIWFWYNTCPQWSAFHCTHGTSTPYPSLADVGFLAIFPCAVLAFAQLGRVLAIDREYVVPKLWIPLVCLVVTAYLTLPAVEVAGVTFGRSWLFDEGYGTSQIVFSLLYLLSDIVILSLGLMLLARSRETAGGMLVRPLLLLSCGLIALYLGDMVFDLRVSNDVYFNGDMADGLYAIAMMLFVLSFVRFRREHQLLNERIAVRAGRVEPERRSTIEVGGER